MKSPNEQCEGEYAAYVGIDWASRNHQVCLRAAGSARDEQSNLPHQPSELHGWAEGLRVRFGGRKIAVAVEQSHGPLVDALRGYSHVVLYPLNPARLAKYREAATAASGSKNDPLDAHLACELVRMHRDWLRPLPAVSAQMRELDMLTQARRELVEERTACCERLGAMLQRYYPQALELVGTELGSPLCCAFLRRWPTLEKLQKARPSTLEEFYRKHNVRSSELIARRVELVRGAVALTSDEAVLAAMPLRVLVIVDQLEVLHTAIATYDKRIAECFAAQPDAALFRSFPGAGANLAPRLMVAFGSDRGLYSTAEDIQRYSGIAPVKQKSGNGLDITAWRWHCPTYLRQTFHEFAGCSVPQSRWAKAYFTLQRERGKSPEKAKRALAFKWQRIIFRCWKDGETYDEERYIAALRDRGSPLVKLIDAAVLAA